MTDIPGKNRLAFDTRTIHGGQFPDPTTGAVMVPIYATSTYVQSSPGEHKGFEYSRSHNPTRFAFERSIADLESGTAGFAFASGLAAASTILETLDSGAHVIASDDLYGGSFRLFDKVRKRSAGLKFSFVDMGDLSAIEAAITPETRMIWVETPTNPMLRLADLAAIADLAKRRGLITVADNTFASPYVQRPLELGFDIVMHSATKYLNGHSDVVAGVAVVGENAELAAQMKFLQNAVGAVLGPVRQLPGPARRQDPGPAHGTRLPERPDHRPVAGGPVRHRAGDLSRPGKPSAACAGQASDAQWLRRHHLGRRQGRPGPGPADAGAHPTVHPRRKPGWRRKPDRASGHHDSRLDPGRATRGPGDLRRPGQAFGGD
jgi:hypothetical protein